MARPRGKSGARKGRKGRGKGPKVIDGRVAVELMVHPDVVRDDAAVMQLAAKKAGLKPKEVWGIEWKRRSIDARGSKVRFNCQVDLVVQAGLPPRARPTPLDLKTLTGTPRVAVIGAGPAGLFAAWALVRQGVPCTVLERGLPVRARRRDLAALTQRGELNPESNYCFGEGGAGTFSDGKLYTRSDKRGDVRSVLETLVAYGAPPDILVNARPHIGTNRLPKVIGSMREHLESVGVEFRFGTRVDALVVEGGQLRGLRLHDGSTLKVQAAVVATGHSARDVYRFLHDAGVAMEAKAFAMGVRVEHRQPLIDEICFGDFAGHRALGSAAYRVVERVGDAGVFSFCMCPGGFMVPATTEVGAQVVNGWSPASRRGKYANSGFVTEVGPEMLAAAGHDPEQLFAGLDFQRELEQRAFAAAGGAYRGPAQTTADFVASKASANLPACSYPRGLVAADLHAVLGPLAPALAQGMAQVGEKMPGYVSDQAVAVGVESRTSSPLRILRDEQTLVSPSVEGLYPCAEGAGYAGGIMSAAIDGIKVAESIAHSLATM